MYNNGSSRQLDEGIGRVQNESASVQLRRTVAVLRVAHFLRFPLACIALTTTLGCAHVVDRDTWQRPDVVMEKLAIKPGERVADLGAGDGYFTFRLAQATGTSGRVYAIDIDAAPLTRIREQAHTRAVSQVQTVLATTSDPALPEPVDLVFLCNTYHHIDARSDYFRQLKRYLRPAGRVAVIDLDNLPWFLFPLWNHQTDATKMLEEMSAAGYRLVQAYDVLSLQNFMIFAPVD